MWRRIAPAERDATVPVASPLSARALGASIAALVIALPMAGWLARLQGHPRLGDALGFAAAACACALVARGIGVRGVLVLAVAAAGFAALARGLHLPPVYWPPVAINLAMAATFAVSLRGEPLVCRFARMQGAPSSMAAERYCRRLTLVWAVWLCLLGAAGVAIAVHGDERLGAWWAAGLNYLLVAALFVGEFAYRRATGRTPAGLLAQARQVRRVLGERHR
jgi:uncharacterized membrane protein